MCLLDLWFSLSYFYSSGPDPACYLNERGEGGSEEGGVVVVGGGEGLVWRTQGSPSVSDEFLAEFFH